MDRSKQQRIYNYLKVAEYSQDIGAGGGIPNRRMDCLFVGGATPPTASCPGWCRHQPGTIWDATIQDKVNTIINIAVMTGITICLMWL